MKANVNILCAVHMSTFVASSYLFILGADEQFLDAPGDGLRPPDHLLLGGQDLLHTS